MNKYMVYHTVFPHQNPINKRWTSYNYTHYISIYIRIDIPIPYILIP